MQKMVKTFSLNKHNEIITTSGKMVAHISLSLLCATICIGKHDKKKVSI
jgi:hypothetical protein